MITQSCCQLGSLLSRAVADPDPEISGGPGLKKYFVQSLGPQFGLKIRGWGGGGWGGAEGPPGPLPWIHH